LNTLNNTSGDAHLTNPTSGYEDFTGLTPTDLEQGSTYSLSVSIDPGGLFLYNVSVFFDWDSNFTFSSPIDERYDLGSLNTSGTLSTNITVPSGASIGNTRMRVVMIFEETASACDPQSSTFGETEDYSVNIVAPTTYVFNNGWTPTNPEGVSTVSNPIQIVAGDYTFTANVDCESITVAPGSTIGVNSGVIINTSNGVLLESVSNSYAGLILNGTITGGISYSRYVNVIGSGTTGGNDLITPPLNGESFGDFAAANDGVLAASGDIRAWAPFNNLNSAYENYDVITNSTTPLLAGVGFRAATVGAANLLFIGSANSTNFNAVITSETGTFGQWNAIGNPYPSYIDINAFLNHSVSGSTNIEKLAADAQAIYGYDGAATDGWDVINLANAAGRLMTPGQGFFVASDALTVLQFTPAMRTPGNSDDFILGRNAPLTFLKLNATNGSQTYNTDIYFNDNGSLDFDPGYDAKIWGGDTSGFKLYSHVVENNMGIPLALQTVNTNHLNDVIIPLGINSSAGTEITFSLADFNLPGTVEVYLEDAVNNSITRIDNGNYTVTLNQTVSGTGRFFLRLTDNSLNIDDESGSRLNIYQLPTEKTIVIAGAINNNTEAHLYDIQGRMVSTTVLNAAQLEQRIDVSGLGTGIYVLSFENGAERISKKLVIQ
jgi:hypothetical protein